MFLTGANQNFNYTITVIRKKEFQTFIFYNLTINFKYA